MAAAALIPDFIVGPPPTGQQGSPLFQFQETAGQIGAHSFAPGHQLRWSERTILSRLKDALALFYTHIAMIGSVLELNRWKVTLIETAQAIVHYGEVILAEGLVHMGCEAMLQIADSLQAAITALCKQLSKWNQRIPMFELPLGWFPHNRFVKV
ncbi:unnamed protein product [Symbiodinium sp. CCMP2592]|nr:unnamed protein product [Symbiodinium sp. CCMP2592]